MEPPPTYRQATHRDPWTLISQHIPSADLCSAALVSREWSRIFMPKLWGNPASHFGHENDAVFMALVRFKRALTWARLETRELTHTLIFPPAQAELYDGPRGDWLLKIMSRLPKLQSLIISGIPFFDQKVLGTLANESFRRDDNDTKIQRITYPLRLLEAANCLNATSIGLQQALAHLTHLAYLDLSKTKSAKDLGVIQSLGNLPSLQILKMRNIGLKDEDVIFLCQTLKLRLRSLDVRDNKLTDESIDMILRECMMTTTTARQILQNRYVFSQGFPVHMQNFYGLDLPTVYRTHDQDEFVKRTLTTGFYNHLAIDDANQTGITHLYISGNQISVHAVAHLLSLQRLNVLDVGTPHQSRTRVKDSNQQTSFFIHETQDLVPLLEKNKEELSYLRMNHSVVTSYIKQEAQPLVVELDAAPASPHIRPETPPIELPANEIQYQELASQPIFELEGSPIPESTQLSQSHVVPNIEVLSSEGESTQPSSDQPSLHRAFSYEQNSNGGSTEGLLAPDLGNHTTINEPLSPVAPGHDYNTSSSFADFILSPLEPRGGIPPPLNLTSATRHSPPHIVSPLRSPTPVITISATETPWNDVDSKESQELQESQELNPILTSRKRSYSGILIDHEARINFYRSQPHGLLPSMLPGLRSLVLTDIPSHSKSEELSQHIIAFIRACGEEAYWSRKQSQVSYALPPGQSGLDAELDHAKSLFALRQIVLEIKPYHLIDVATNATLQSPRNFGQSTTEDADCDEFYNAGANDFSFFDNGEDECGIPESEMMNSIPLEVRLGKMVVSDDEFRARSFSQPKQPGVPTASGIRELIDTVAEIGKFRKAMKALHQAAIGRNELNPFVEGYWDGEIVVVRTTT